MLIKITGSLLAVFGWRNPRSDPPIMRYQLRVNTERVEKDIGI